MNVVARFDSYQRQHRWIGMPLAVLYKYVDDQGGYLAALITYYAFLSLFPLLLLLITVLGFVLQGDPDLQQRALNSALGQFPIVGQQIGDSIHRARGSIAAVVIGTLGSLYGAIGAAQATQNALNIVWAIPRNSRPNPIKSRLRSVALLGVLGIGLLATTGLSGVTTNLDVPLGGPVTSVGATVLSIALNVVLFIVAFRLLTARAVTIRQVRGGAIAAAVGWQILQTIGTYLFTHQLKGVTSSYGVFGTVLGMIVFLHLAAMLVVFCAEANVVRARQMWPRSLLTPFTDDVQLTEGDRRAYTSYATAQRNKGFQNIKVDFHRPRGGDGGPKPPADKASAETEPDE